MKGLLSLTVCSCAFSVNFFACFEFLPVLLPFFYLIIMATSVKTEPVTVLHVCLQFQVNLL